MLWPYQIACILQTDFKMWSLIVCIAFIFKLLSVSIKMLVNHRIFPNGTTVTIDPFRWVLWNSILKTILKMVHDTGCAIGKCNVRVTWAEMLIEQFPIYCSATLCRRSRNTWPRCGAINYLIDKFWKYRIRLCRWHTTESTNERRTCCKNVFPQKIRQKVKTGYVLNEEIRRITEKVRND